jgi:hypothetical protein
MKSKTHSTYSSALYLMGKIKKDEIAGEFSVIRQTFCQVKYISAEEIIFFRFIRSVKYGGITVRELF